MSNKVETLMKEGHPILEKLKSMGASIEFEVPFAIHHELISNQIIRYKDIQKIPTQDLKVPLLVRSFNQAKEPIAMVLTLSEDEYIIAKGLYLVLSEPKGELEALKNSTIAAHLEHPGLIEAFTALQAHQVSAGSIQRSLDKAMFKNYEDLIEKASLKAASLQVYVEEKAKTEDKAQAISEVILKWFLLKKLVYVHTMMNRNLLTQVCQNDLHLQRHYAKKNADSIQFVMYSQLWRNS